MSAQAPVGSSTVTRHQRRRTLASVLATVVAIAGLQVPLSLGISAGTAQAANDTCSFATPGSGPYSRQICWFDLTNYNSTQAASGQNMTQYLDPGHNYKLSYTITATGTATGDTNVSAASLPTYSQAFLGNNRSAYSNNYQGIKGLPALYQQTAGATTTLTLTNISLTGPNGPVTGFALVGADAESTDGNNEYITWTSDKPLVSIGNLQVLQGSSYSPACPGGLTPTPDKKSWTCKGLDSQQSDKAGAAILYSIDPGTFTQKMHGNGLQAVAFGVMVSGVQLVKQTTNLLTSDAFAISATGSGIGTTTKTTDASGTTDTGQIYDYTITPGSPATYTLSETAANTNTKLANYETTWACTRNGSSFTPDGASATSKTVTLNVGDFVVCTITNTGPRLTLQKSVDNAAAGSTVNTLKPGAWTLTATGSGGGQPTISESPAQPASISGTITTAATSAHPVPADSYTLGESSTATGNSSYTAGAWGCVLTGTSTTVPVTSGVVNLAAGQDVTCTITNTASTGSLTWSKVADDGSTLLPGSTWTLTKPGGGTATVTDCTSSPCTGLLDQDPAAGQFKLTGLTWGTYKLKEATPPAGYTGSGTTYTTTIDGTGLNGSFGDSGTPGKIKNTAMVGSVTWSKVDGSQTSNLLGGSEWTLTGTSSGASYPNGTTITDCAQSPCTGPDQDSTPGKFNVAGLKLGDYTLVESKAPVGFKLDATTKHNFTITADGQSIPLNSITNTRSSVPTLPLTGGTSADAFLLAGGLMAASGAGMWLRRRRSTARRH